MSEYIYDANWESERARLAGLEAALDPNTTRHLTNLGVTEGWRCLEVGAGGGSIAAWLCAQVGPSGHVVATDLDPRFVSAIEAPNLEVRTHNAVTDAFETGVYDLVHSRDVLEHIPERLDVLAKLVAAAKPGGWVLIEDVDFLPEASGPGLGMRGDDAELFRPFWAALNDWMRSRGVDPTFGRALPRAMRDLGLTDVDGEASARVLSPDHPSFGLPKLSMQHLGPTMVADGALTQGSLDRLVAMMDDPEIIMFSPIHVSVWGRKPG